MAAADLWARGWGAGATAVFAAAGQLGRIAGRMVGPIPCPAGLGTDEATFATRRPLEQLVLSCSAAALRDAGWWDDRGSLRVGRVMTVIGGLGFGFWWVVVR